MQCNEGQLERVAGGWMKMQKKRLKNIKSILSICMFVLLVCNFWSPVFAGEDFKVKFNTNVLQITPGSGKNEWQIMKGGYVGPYDGSDVSTGFDAKANVSYSSDNAVRLTKNVISTDIENEFLMYLNVEPQISWEEVLQLNTLMVTNANKDVSPPEWPDQAGKPSYLRPEMRDGYTTPVQIEYYAIANGKRIVIANVTMYANTNKVPRGAYGIGNPLLEPSGGTFSADNEFDLKATGNGSISKAEIDISTIYNKYEFSTKKVRPKNVKDQMGKYISIYEDSLNYDGGVCVYQSGYIDWTLPDADLGLLSYTIGTDNTVYPEGVLRGLGNGKSTYYRETAYQMTYRFSLSVEGEGFISCNNAYSVNDCAADYAVQTNVSPELPDNKEIGGTVTYETNGISNSGYFYSPYIKGLLYNVEFQKVLEESKIPLEGITFSIERKIGGENHSENVRFSAETISGKEGWVKFRNMPWGEYIVKEIAYQEGNEFQDNYLKQELPKEIAVVQIGQVINGDALIDDHDSLHECDAVGDTKNQLFLLNGGIVGNQPYRAKLTIRKIVSSYQDIPDTLKTAKYSVETISSDIYIKPESEQETMQFLNDTKEIAHLETITYDLIVPQDGGTVILDEIIPEDLKSKVQFGMVMVEANAESTMLGNWTAKPHGCSIKILPENDITVTVTNIPVGRIYIKEVTDNFCSQLVDDTFIIQVVSGQDTGEKINTQVVLKHNEISPAIKITECMSFKITEILPKEYNFSNITLTGGGQLIDNNITVRPGEEITITIHNCYENKPFFHASDEIKNIFQ